MSLFVHKNVHLIDFGAYLHTLNAFSELFLHLLPVLLSCYYDALSLSSSASCDFTLFSIYIATADIQLCLH